MRSWINIIVEGFDPGQQVRITDLYEPHELTDESERIAHCAPPMNWDDPLTVRSMSAHEARQIITPAGNTVWDAFQSDASKGQKRLVAQKVKDFDPDRIIVIEDDTIVDGNHQLVAAIMADHPVLYVNLSEWDELMEDYGAGYDRLPKPYTTVRFEEEGDEARVYKNPQAGLLKKIIGDHDCRALLHDETGDLYVWPEFNCYHDDVRKGLNIGRITRLMLQNPAKLHQFPCVSTKGWTSEPEPETDEKVLAALHANRGLRNLFGENFEVDRYDWG